MALNTYGSVGENQLSNEGRIYYNRDLIPRLLPYLPFFQDGQKRTIPARTGGFGSGQLHWRKVAALATATTPLTEGTPPVAKNLTVTTVTANLSQYGDIVEMSDVLLGASIDDMAREGQDVLAEQAGQTLAALIVTEWKLNTTTQIANGRAGRADLVATDVLNAYEVKKAVRQLHRNKVPRFPDGFYHGLFHPDQLFDLSNDDEWVDFSTNSGSNNRKLPNLEQYGNNGFAGYFHNVLWRMSTEAPAYTGPSTYGTLIYGPNWFGIADFVGMTVANVDPDTNTGIDVSYIPPTVRTKDDPLGQRGVAGWKVAFVCKILDNARCILLHAGSTA